MSKPIKIISNESISLDEWRDKLLGTIEPNSKIELQMPKASFTFTRAFLTIFNIIASERNCQIKFFNEKEFKPDFLLPHYSQDPSITKPKGFAVNKTK